MPFFIFCYLFVTNFINLENLFFSLIAKVFGIIFLFLSYVLLLSFTLINITGWKIFFKSIIFVNFRKVHYSILLLALTLILTFLSAYLIYYTTMILANIYLMFLSTIILFPLILIFNRILLIVYSSEIIKGKNYSTKTYKTKKLLNKMVDVIRNKIKWLKKKI